MRKTFILALHQGKSVQNRGQSVILSGENHRLPYTITGGDTILYRLVLVILIELLCGIFVKFMSGRSTDCCVLCTRLAL